MQNLAAASVIRMVVDRESQNLGNAGAHPFGWGAADPLETPLHHVLSAEFLRSRSNGMKEITKICHFAHRVPPFKVTVTTRIDRLSMTSY